MTRDEIVAYIQQVRFGYLATAGADNVPHVRPIGIYNVYGDGLYWFTLSVAFTSHCELFQAWLWPCSPFDVWAGSGE